jgi:hypothetical protein
MIPRRMRRTLLILLAPCTVALVACGGSPPPKVEAPVVAEPATQEDHAPTSHGPAMMYDVGDVDPGIAKKAWETLKPQWNDCFSAQHEKNAALEGKVTMALRTNGDGTVKWVYVMKSDLGSRTVEKCMLAAVSAINWGTPMDAKEGEIKEHTYGWAVDGDAAEPAKPGAVTSVEKAIDKAKGKLDACRKDAKGPFIATIYVAPGGKPKDVGLSTGDPSGEGATDCIVDVLAKLKYENKTGHVTKVTLELP